MVGCGRPIFSISAAIMIEEGLERKHGELERAYERQERYVNAL